MGRETITVGIGTLLLGPLFVAGFLWLTQQVNGDLFVGQLLAIVGGLGTGLGVSIWFTDRFRF